MNKEYKILEDTDLNNKIKCFFISIAFAFFEICENNEDSKIILDNNKIKFCSNKIENCFSLELSAHNYGGPHSIQPFVDINNIKNIFKSYGFLNNNTDLNKLYYLLSYGMILFLLEHNDIIKNIKVVDKKHAYQKIERLKIECSIKHSIPNTNNKTNISKI